MGRALIAVTLVVALGGCRSGLLDPPDLLFDAAGGGADLTRGGRQCQLHALETQPLSDLALLDGPGAAHQGRVVRLRVAVPLREGCDLLGPIDFGVMAGDATDFVGVAARVWRGTGICGQVVSAPRVVVLPASFNQWLAIRDTAPGGTLGLTVENGPLEGTGCDARLQGSPCERDCQCTGAGVACIGSSPICAASCSEDADCGDPRVHACGARSLCTSGESCSGCANGCPYGQSCGGCGCAPTTVWSKASCRCDLDCADGQICRTDKVCSIPCVTSFDCVPGLVCTLGGTCEPLD